jgi:iron complex outermembrane recepter protein
VKAASTTKTYGASAGIAVDTANQWRLTFSGSFGEERARFQSNTTVNMQALDAALADPDPATALNLFADGSNTNAATLDAIRGAQVNNADSTLRER